MTTSMTEDIPQRVFAGIDSHRDTLHVAVVGAYERPLADAEFPTTTAGYADALRWLRGHGQLVAVGVEGTSSYGTGISMFLRAEGVEVVEVDRPDRRERRRAGKSDPLDAYSAARAAASGRASGQPKAHDGIVESIRALRVARSSAVKARTQAINQLKQLLVTAPAALRERIGTGTGPATIEACARLRSGTDLADPTAATKLALRRLARRCQLLTEEITEFDRELDQLTITAAPALRLRMGVGPDTAATLLTAAGDNPDRLGSEAAFARLCGAAPIPASSGRTDRHRLSRGGNRDANRALYIVAITRLQRCPRTIAYAERRRGQGLSHRDILRCLKRYIARELYYLIIASGTVTTPETRPATAA